MKYKVLSLLLCLMFVLLPSKSWAQSEENCGFPEESEIMDHFHETFPLFLDTVSVTDPISVSSGAWESYSCLGAVTTVFVTKDNQGERETLGISYFTHLVENEYVLSDPYLDGTDSFHYMLLATPVANGILLQTWYLDGTVNHILVDDFGRIETSSSHIWVQAVDHSLMLNQQDDEDEWPDFVKLTLNLPIDWLGSEGEVSMSDGWQCLNEVCDLAYIQVFVLPEVEFSNWDYQIVYFAKKSDSGWEVSSPSLIEGLYYHFNVQLNPIPGGYQVVSCFVDNRYIVERTRHRFDISFELEVDWFSEIGECFTEVDQ